MVPFYSARLENIYSALDIATVGLAETDLRRFASCPDPISEELSTAMSPDNKTIRVVVADDHPIFREGLVTILNCQTDMTVVGESGNGREAVELVLRLLPDVTVLDLQMPEMNGEVAIATILEKLPKARVLLLTNYAGGHDIQQAMQSGARGYLLKGCRKEEVLQAIRDVAQGGLYLSPAAGASFAQASLLRQKLTKRECEILRLISEGKGNKEIGANLDISEGTVKKHVNGVMQKMNAKSRTEAALAAQRLGLLREPV